MAVRVNIQESLSGDHDLLNSTGVAVIPVPKMQRR